MGIGSGIRAEILDEFRDIDPTVHFQEKFYKHVIASLPPEPPFSLLRRRLEAERYAKYEIRIEKAWRNLLKNFQIPLKYLYGGRVPANYFYFDKSTLDKI